MEFTVDWNGDSYENTDEDLSRFYSLGRITTSHIKSLDVASYSADIAFQNLSGHINVGKLTEIVQQALDQLLNDIVHQHNIQVPAESLIFSVRLKHSSLNVLNKNSVYLPPRKSPQNNAGVLFAMIRHACQSSEGIELDNTMRLSITDRPDALRGGNDPDLLCLIRAFTRGFFIADFKATKIVLKQRYGPKNYARSKIYKKYKKQYEKIMDDDSEALKCGNEYVQRMFGKVPDPNSMMGIEHLKCMETGIFGRYRLFVYCKTTGKFLYQSFQDNFLPIIALTFDDEKKHYEPLLNFRKQLGVFFDHWCPYCGEMCKQKMLHQVCKHKCLYCQKQSACARIPGEETKCPKCNITFKNKQCFENHFFRGKCLALRYRCDTCDRTFFSRPVPIEKHVCNGTVYCARCNDYVTPDHECSWKPTTPKMLTQIEDAKKDFKHIYYDFETRCNTVEGGEIVWTPQQVVTHAVARMVCSACCDPEYDPEGLEIKKGKCKCLKESIVFSEVEGSDVLDRFGRWLFFDPIANHYTAFAHNGARFDSHFILDFLLTKNIVPRIVNNGQNLIMLQTMRERKRKQPDSNSSADLLEICSQFNKFEAIINNIKVVDTFNWMPIGLAKFAGSFGLQVGKGHFPVFANCDFFKERTEWPAAKFFNADKKSAKERADILQFIAEKEARGEKFILEKEIVKYCKQDVEVLMKGALKFRRSFIQSAGIDPYKNDVTLAGACLRSFRVYHNKYNIVAIPENGYNANRKYSKISIQWLEWEANQKGFHILHAENGGEQVVSTKSGKKYRVDGYYEDPSNGEKHVFEFFGCLYHSHTCLGQGETMNTVTGCTFAEGYEETLLRIENLREAGYTVHTIWECEVRHLLAADRKMKDFFRSCQATGPLKPRQGLKGGRTGSCLLKVNEAPGREIMYYDIKSLYPTIQCCTEYALGTPTVYNRPSIDDCCSVQEKQVVTYENGLRKDIQKNVQVLKHRGLYLCSVLPPRNQYVALLPTRHNDMLFYTLCRTCMEKFSKTGANIYSEKLRCRHSDQERALTDVWYHEELQLALDHDYRILAVHEAWAWTEFTPGAEYGRMHDNGLFTSYMRTFFKDKEEASGFPENVVSSEDKRQYLQNFSDTLGIQLNCERMEHPNKELRFVSKLCCNSLWGRFAMRIQRSSNTFAKTREQADKIWYDPSVVITNDHIMENSKIWLFTHHPHNDALTSADYGSLIVGIITLSCARKKLTQLLLELQGTGPLTTSRPRIAYFDTDSVMWVKENAVDEETTHRFLERNAGENLGQLTNEIPDGWKGVKLVAPGSKQYALTVSCGLEKTDLIKLRGLTQNWSTKELATSENLDLLTDALQTGEEVEGLLFNSTRIKKDMGKVNCVDTHKSYLARNCKGILKDYVVYPFGYQFDN